jgi:hypothetical protein
MRDHERSDWNLNYVTVGFVALVIAVTVILSGGWWIFGKLQNSAASREVQGTRLTEKERIPPEPRLQIAPDEEWEQMLKREQAILNSYRWVDRSQGIIHIPIDRAMELIAEGKRQ